MTQIIALSTIFNSYPSRSTGEIIENYDLYYFNPKDLNDNPKSQDKGYLPVSTSLDLSKFTPGTDFQTLPASYKIQQTLISIRRYGRTSTVPKFLSSELQQQINFFPKNDDSYLVLGGSSKNTEIEGNKIKGLKLFVLSPHFSDETHGLYGLSILEPFISTQDGWRNFNQVPGYYNLDFTQVRGSGGSAVTKITDFNFVAPFDLSSLKATKKVSEKLPEKLPQKLI